MSRGASGVSARRSVVGLPIFEQLKKRRGARPGTTGAYRTRALEERLAVPSDAVADDGELARAVARRLAHVRAHTGTGHWALGEMGALFLKATTMTHRIPTC